MSVTELKQALHNRIEEIDDQSRLEEILALMDENPPADTLSGEEIAILEERQANYLKGHEKAIPIDEFNTGIKEKYGF